MGEHRHFACCALARISTAFACVALTLALCPALPVGAAVQPAWAEEATASDAAAGEVAAADNDAAADTAVGTDTTGEQPASSQVEATPAAADPLATTIKGLKKSYKLSYKKSLKATVTITPAYGRSVKLYRYDDHAKKYKLAKTYTTANKKTAKIKVTFPKIWKTQAQSTWKLVVPAVKAVDAPAAGEKTAGDAAATAAAPACPAMEKASKKVKVTCATGLLCSAAIVMDVKTGEVVFGKSPHKKRAIASMTKMMTALLLVEKRTPSALVKVTKEAAKTPWGIGLKKGDALTVKSLLYAMMLPSANDAACAAGVDIGGSTKKFCKLANARAKELGCLSTTYKNAHGLDRAGAGSTAYDQALIARELMTSEKCKLIRKIVKTKYKTIKTKKGNVYHLASTDKLLGTKWKPLGIKTGTETLAGCCFCGAFKISGRTYVTVVMNSPWSSARWTDTQTLVTFAKYAAKNKLPRLHVG